MELVPEWDIGLYIFFWILDAFYYNFKYMNNLNAI